MDGAAAGLRQTTVSHMQTVIRPISREPALDLVQRSKTPPKGAAIFVAHCLTRDPRLVDEYHGRAVVAEMHGVTDIEAVHKQVRELAASGDGRAQVITLALVLGALEARTPKDAWRGSPSWGHHVGAADLLKFLTDNGYPLSDVERVMVGERTSEGVYSELCS
jgi:ParB family transcriptional regulator, chromosome partitioning protein